MKVLIATPFFNAMTWTQYVKSMVRTQMMLHEKKIKYDVYLLPSDAYIYRARGFIANVFLKNKEFTHLFFIDADMEWTPEAFLKVLNCREEFCGANYPRKNMYNEWAALEIPGVVQREDGLIECAVIPGGFCKIARSVFEKIHEKTKEKWRLFEDEIPDFFSHIKLVNNTVLGEDNSFCYRWHEAGGKCWIVPDCDLSHVGFYPFAGNYAQYLKSKKEETKKEEVPA